MARYSASWRWRSPPRRCRLSGTRAVGAGRAAGWPVRSLNGDNLSCSGACSLDASQQAPRTLAGSSSLRSRASDRGHLRHCPNRVKATVGVRDIRLLRPPNLGRAAAQVRTIAVVGERPNGRVRWREALAGIGRTADDRLRCGGPAFPRKTSPAQSRRSCTQTTLSDR
jgi:hypothetical protein